jgi:hypothetical protein
MSKWLDRFNERQAQRCDVPIMPFVPIVPNEEIQARPNGTFGAIGTPDQDRNDPARPFRDEAIGAIGTQTENVDGPVGEWLAGFRMLSPEHPPCPAFRRWYEVHRAARQFLDMHADRAAAFGWTTLELWGVHHKIGTLRLDCSGALMISGGAPIVEVTPLLIRYGNGLAYRRAQLPSAAECIPVWKYAG